MDILQWLQKWYVDNRAGHNETGIRINSRANEGWQVLIGLGHTYLNNCPMPPNIFKRSDTDYISCHVKNNIFTAICGPLNLNEVLEAFRDWALENEI